MAGRSSHEIDILNGPILKKYFLFIIPLALGNILQLLFNAADVIVVGRFAGAGALAAVGSTTALVNLYIQIFIGLSTGVNIQTAGAYATGNHDKVSRIVHASMGLSLMCGIATLIFALITVRPLLILTSTPDDILDMTCLYMYIYCIGLPASVVYNFGSAILRSIGDTKRPMYYLIAAGIVNLVLNIISVVCLGMGVAGVAIATTVSNFISAILVLQALIREDSALKLNLRKLSLDRRITKDIMTLGVPIAVQNSLYSIPNIMIQSSINTFGSIVVAGNAASQSIEGFQIAFLTSNGIAAATFTAQHVSARKFKRADKVMRTILICAVIISLSMGITFSIFRAPLLSLYNKDPEVIAIGSRRLVIMVMTDFLDAIMSIFSNTLRGYGKSIQPTLITLIFVCGFRMIWIIVLLPFFNFFEFVLLAWPVSWILSIIVLVIYFTHVRAGFPREDLG
ncbi:MAG: MATE family efflux transporter [Eubacteriales bacterium]|nr:MATE family efflux transporter [Eubacteriales bacterium]